MDKVKRQTDIVPGRGLRVMAGRLMGIAAVVCVLAFAARGVRAQTPQEPTQIAVGAPAKADLGSPVTVQAVLADSQGRPISGAQIFFTTQATFLGVTNDVVLAQAVTNANGQAVAHFLNDSSGNLSLQAEFRGDEQYAPSTATTQLDSIGQGQVYSDHFVAQTAGLNATLPGASTASIESLPLWIQTVRSAVSGWPVATALLLVWSLYVVAVGFVFRIAALAKQPEPPPPAGTPDPRRSP